MCGKHAQLFNGGASWRKRIPGKWAPAVLRIRITFRRIQILPFKFVSCFSCCEVKLKKSLFLQCIPYLLRSSKKGMCLEILPSQYKSYEKVIIILWPDPDPEKRMWINAMLIWNTVSRGSKRDVVYLNWPIAPLYGSPNAGGVGWGVSANEYSCTQEPK